MLRLCLTLGTTQLHLPIVFGATGLHRIDGLAHGGGDTPRIGVLKVLPVTFNK